MHPSPVVAAIATVLFQVGFLAAVGHPQAPAYLLTCAALGVGWAALAGLTARLGLPEAGALALWGSAYGLVLLGPTAGAVMLAGGWIALRAGRLPSVAAGLATSLALVGSLLVWPRVRVELGLPQVRGSAGDVVQAGLYVLGLAVLGAMSRRWSWRPLASAGLAASLVAMSALPLLGNAEPALPRYPETGRGAAPSIVLLILDTVRADHLSIYGYHRETTPELAAFLARTPRARLYPLAYATGTWTLPSHASLFTGTTPSEHGVDAHTAFVDQQVAETELYAAATLAEVLRARGYRTACVFANAWLRYVDGLARGFDWFVRPLGYAPLPLLGERVRAWLLPGTFVKEARGALTAEIINDHVLRFLDRCRPGPCFVVANYMEAHAPYEPPRSTAGLFAPERKPWTRAPKLADPPEKVEYLKAVYDEEIRGLDAQLGALIRELEERGVLDESWLVITSDHGEGFGEHGIMEHGTTVYAEVTRIPLLVVPPAGIELPPPDRAAGLLDVATTLAAVGGVPGFGRGRDLRAASEPAAVPVEFFGDERKVRLHGLMAAEPARSVTRDGWRLIEHAGRRELYRVDVDPSERHDLAGEEPDLVEALGQELPALDREGHPVPTGERALSPAEREQLRALGYIE